VAEENNTVLEKDAVLDELKSFIQPYYVYDRGGQCVEALAQIAWDIYRSDIKQLSTRDPDTVVSPKLLRDAAREALQFNPGESDPSVNEFPVVPFKQGMTNQAMNEIWKSVTEEDLMEMNGGLHPVDSIDKMDAEPIDFEKLKAGWLVYVAPGKYNIGVPDTENPEAFVYAVNPRTKLCYVFDYNLKASELENRRL
jgi:hypothetical protein